jgi:hypothetical protein
MKSSILIAAIVVCALSAPIVSVSAQEKSAPAKPAMSMDMGSQMPQMLENMKKMQAQMEMIRKTTDSKERRKLLREHMQAMQAGMSMMQSVGGPMLMRMMGDKPGTSDPKQQQEMMAWRMDMMQMMMEQVIQHEQMTDSKPAR